jgi:hypothetical protein
MPVSWSWLLSAHKWCFDLSGLNFFSHKMTVHFYMFCFFHEKLNLMQCVLPFGYHNTSALVQQLNFLSFNNCLIQISSLVADAIALYYASALERCLFMRFLILIEKCKWNYVLDRTSLWFLVRFLERCHSTWISEYLRLHRIEETIHDIDVILFPVWVFLLDLWWFLLTFWL